MPLRPETNCPRLIAVMGPTASGKTELAEAIAETLDAQLLNADAFQIYRGMDIGTAKPSRPEAYKLIDIRDPSESFGVGEFVSLAQEVLKDCWALQRSVVVVGGTGLYIRALFEEYSDMAPAPDAALRSMLDQKSLDELISQHENLAPEALNRLDSKNRVRVQRSLERILGSKPSVPVELPPFQKLKLAVILDPLETSDRISRRIESMVQNGWVQEVRNLAGLGVVLSDPGMRALGYKCIWHHIQNELPLEEAVATTIADTRKYAKRQRTWLRSERDLVVLDTDNALQKALDIVLFDRE